MKLSASDRNYNKIFKNTVIYSLGNLVVRLYVIFTTPILTRYLDGNEYGFYIIIIQLISIIEQVGLALFSQALVKFYYEYEGKARSEFLGTIVISLITLNISIAVLIFNFRNIIIPVLYPNINIPLDPYIGYALVWLVLVPMRALAISLSQIKEKPFGTFIVIFTYGVSFLSFLLFLLVVKSCGLKGALQAMILAELCCIAVSLLFIWKGQISVVWRKVYAQKCLSFAAPLVISSLAFVVFLNLDRIILSRYISLQEIGIYGFGLILGNTVGLIVGGYSGAYTPRILNMMIKEDSRLILKTFQKIQERGIAIIAIYVGLIYVGNDLLVFILGRYPAFKAAAFVMAGIGTGHFFRSIYLYAENVLFYKGRTNTILLLNLVLLAVCFGVTIFMAGCLGAKGVSYSAALSYILLLPVGYNLAKKHFPLEFPCTQAFKAIAVLLLFVIAEMIIDKTDRNIYSNTILTIKIAEIFMLLLFFAKDAFSGLKELKME